MDNVAQSAAIRGALFPETAVLRGFTPEIIEKDFWVCWTLSRLFALPAIGEYLLFKGGTSLSKVFGLIDRFSEDIDLGIERELLGFEGEKDPEKATSSNSRKRLVAALVEESRRFVAGELRQKLTRNFSNVLGESCAQEDWKPNGTDWFIETEEQPDGARVLNFVYPSQRSAVLDIAPYIRPLVRLEVGARAAHFPSGQHSIRSYAADEYPHLFEQPDCAVTALEPERTFWEKATILHALHYLPQGSPTPSRYSRHLYDLVKIARSDYGENALSNYSLLENVVKFKNLYFPRARDQMELAIPGTLRLCPSTDLVDALRRDYDQMEIMFFGEAPAFDEILNDLRELEKRINGS